MAGNWGRIIFFALLLMIGIIAILAFNSSGSKGIEERFSSALGISADEEGQGNESNPGFSLEGNPLLYVIVLALLGGVCWAVYWKFGT